MAQKTEVLHRAATAADAFALMRLYQLSMYGAPKREALFLDHAGLENELSRKDRRWVLAEKNGEVIALAGLSVEEGNRIGKLNCLLSRPANKADLSAALGLLMKQVSAEAKLEVIYSTTQALTLEQQALTLEHGFKILGVFPNAMSADSHKLNGLTVWYAPGVLESRRYESFELHSAVVPFYDLARKALGGRLKPLGALAKSAAASSKTEAPPLPALELIEAPGFTAERYRRLKARRNLSVNFYPFQSPNAVFTSADQGVEVFAIISRERRFAGLIGEHLSVRVDPAALYREIVRMLFAQSINYVEIINDASDAAAIQAMLQAGFAPCGYFPALRDSGEFRRDYVVFARSAEFFHYTPLKVDGLYSDYLIAFCKARSTLPISLYADIRKT